MPRKIMITYDAVNGTPVRDADTHVMLNDFAKSPEAVDFVVGTENFISALQVAVKKNIIPSSDVMIFFNDYVITVSEQGRLSAWPEGFCSHKDDCLMHVLDD